MSSTLVLESIPHRPPFLYVDEIESLTVEKAVTRFFVRPEADFFRGHYPGNPIMPGVLICECCFQAGAILISHRRGGYNAASGTPVLTRIQDARFRRMVRPGETLRVEASIVEELPDVYYMSGSASVGDEVAVKVSYACMLAKSEGK